MSMPLAKPLPPAKVMRLLPYWKLANVILNITDSAIQFYHHAACPKTGQAKKVRGTHKLTSQEITTLNAGGIVVIKDNDGTTHNVKL